MSLIDSIMVPRYLLIVAITTIIAIFVWFSFQTQMAIVVSGTTSNSTVVTVMNELRTTYISIDYMFPFLVLGLLIVSLIFAFKSGASVLYSFISLIFWGFALLLSAVFSNIFELFADSFPTVIVETPIINYIFMNLKWLVLVWAFLISIVMFTRTSNEEGQLNDRVYEAREAYYG